MKKTKVFFLAAVLITAMGFSVSCSDSESDDIKDLQNQVDGLDATIQNQIKVLTEAKSSLEMALAGKTDKATTEQLSDLVDQINGVLGISVNNEASVKEKTELIKSLSDCLLSIKAWDELYSEKHLGNYDQLLLWHDSVSASVTTAKAALLLAQKANSLAGDAQTLAETADNLANSNKEKIGEMTTEISEMSGNIADLTTEISGINGRIDTLSANIYKKANEVLASANQYIDDKCSELEKLLNEKASSVDLDQLRKDCEKADENLQKDLDKVSDKCKTLESDYKTLKSDFDNLKTKVDGLAGKVDTIQKQLDNMVTGILVQGVSNPLWGMYKSPLGFSSNILVSLYGETGSYPVVFPANNTFNYVDAKEFVDFSEVNSGEIVAYDGEIITSAAGKLYLTVNPSNVNYDGVKMSLVNSMDEQAAGFDAFTLKKCNDVVLKFGSTRAAMDNGFYEAEVTVNDPSAAQFEIDSVTLKNAAKDFYNNRGARNLANLILNVNQQLSNKLDAYAVKCSWNNGNKVSNIYSEYNIAATAFKPLSYEFLKGKSINKHLPMIPDLESKLKEHGITVSKFEYNPAEASSMQFTVTIPDVNSVDIDIIGGKGVVKSINDTTITVTVPASAMEDLIKQINNRVGGLIDHANEIVGQYDRVVKLSQTEIIDRVDKYLGKVNNLLDKDLNKLLQITVLFENGEGEFSQLNATEGYGTKMKLGATATLYPTSYTAELLAPAYKKFVAVTKVTRDGAKIASAMKNANAQDDFNKVLDGSVKEISFTPSEAGEYEIAYTAVDYSGKITARKFYIDVE